jgi:hypothetical protein
MVLGNGRIGEVYNIGGHNEWRSFCTMMASPDLGNFGLVGGVIQSK